MLFPHPTEPHASRTVGWLGIHCSIGSETRNKRLGVSGQNRLARSAGRRHLPNVFFLMRLAIDVCYANHSAWWSSEALLNGLGPPLEAELNCVSHMGSGDDDGCCRVRTANDGSWLLG